MDQAVEAYAPKQGSIKKRRYTTTIHPEYIKGYSIADGVGLDCFHPSFSQ